MGKEAISVISSANMYYDEQKSDNTIVETFQSGVLVIVQATNTSQWTLQACLLYVLPKRMDEKC